MKEIEFDNFDTVVRKCKELAKFKNEQYGVDNLLIFEGFGILTRINDKVARLNNQLSNFNSPVQPVIDDLQETLNDTLLDLINYAIYLYLLKNNILLKK